MQIIRQWRASPVVTAFSIVSLALGIGAASTVFSVLHAALIDPYPYRGADRMVRLRVQAPTGARNFLLLSAEQFAHFRKVDALDGAVAMDRWEMVSTSNGLPEAVVTASLSTGAFEYFGVSLLLGRYFSGPDTAVVVLSYPYWQRRYGGSREALGKTIRLDRRNYTVIGVAPPRFRWGNADVYAPLTLTQDPNRVYIVDARLRRGVSDRQAAAELQPILDRFAIQTPGHFPPHFRVDVSRLTGGGDTRATLFILLTAVGVLLAVACGNVSILLLARGTARAHEFAVRVAMGATRARLMRQLFTESVALALAGGAAGVLLAVAGIRAVVAWLPNGVFPPETDIRLSLPVLTFATAVSVVTGVLFGISPALRFSAVPLAGQRTTPGALSRRTHSMLAAVQIALTLLLLTGAAAALRRFDELRHARLGYDPGNVLTASISLPDGSYTTYAPRAAFYERIRKGVAALPGVNAAAISLFPIPPLGTVSRSLEIAGQAAEKARSVLVEQVTPEYFSALRIPLTSGRSWSEAETSRAAHLAVVNRAMAQRYWPGASPLGQRIRLTDFTAFTAWMVAAEGSNDWLEVIGVCGDTPLNGLRESLPAAAYVPYTLVIGDAMNLVIRTHGAPLNVVRALREQVRSVDPSQPLTQIRTAEDLLREEGWGREQFVASVFTTFAGIAILLAAAGLFSVMSYTIAVRRREFGIRAAIGAQRRHLAMLALRQAGGPLAAGLAGGIALSLASDRLMNRWIATHGVEPAWLGVLAVPLAASSAAACLIPAWRAANSDPMNSLHRG